MTIPAPVPASSARSFTVESANRTLPLVRRIAEDLVGLYNDLHRRRERLVSLRSRQGRPNRGPDDPYEAEVIQMEADLEQDVERLQEYMEELKQVGVELRDPFTGAIDFRTQLDGQEAYLCWQPGDEEVAHWRPLNSRPDERISLLAGSGAGDSFAGSDTPHQQN